MSEADERTTPTRLLIVARPHPDLYEYLRARFSDDANVTITLDRRFAARRRRAVPAAAERRRVDRRSKPDVDEQLQAHALAIVTPSAASTLHDARQWLEAIQSRVAGIRMTLDDRDRLQREADALKLENARLRADADWSRKGLEEIDATLARALETANDVLARLRDGPAQGRTG